MQLDGIPSIVTGGASGLGGATAAMLAAAGAKVTIVDMNADLGAAHAATIGGRFAQVNVTDTNAVDQALEEAAAAHGVARILVNAAGIAIGIKTVGRDFVPHAADQFRRVIEVNLIGSFNAATRFAARLAQADPLGEERGVIINTASVAAYEGQVGQIAYSASKGGVVGMTLPMARDLAQYGIRVCTVAPGIFWTPMMAGMSEEVQASLGKQIPFPSRLGRPEEYAQLVRAIVENPMLNGETIRLDGAVRMAPR
jgi:NAD(P)-dependent dehydrogenase (short-subunit alcohol dehydrogenase family)